MGAKQIIAAGNLESEPVWIIEDDPFARTLLEEWLTQAGFRVIAHTRGAGMLGEQVVDAGAICLDLALQDVRGIDLLKHFLDKEPSVPIVALAPESELPLAHEAMRAGAYDFLTKPLDRDRLEYSVRRAIDRRLLVRTIERFEHDVALRQASAGQDAMDGGLCSCEVLNLRELERMAIDKALKAANGSVGKAAKLLGMGRATLYRRLAETAAQPAKSD